MIVWNFDEECFEIKCLSKKYPIMIDKTKVSFEDPAYPLKSGQIIGISSESFFFLLPPGEGAKNISKTVSAAIQDIIGDESVDTSNIGMLN